MAFHHVSFATKDLPGTHRFYTEVMGFELVQVRCGSAPDGAGWSRLAFYDTGGDGMMSFFDLHDDQIGDGYRVDLSESLGLPVWVNHVAFDAPTLDALEERTRRWQEHGITVTQLDWGNTLSIYTVDPNGILVEFSYTRGTFATADDRAEAPEKLTGERPQLESPPTPKFFPALAAAHAETQGSGVALSEDDVGATGV
jgi:catechol 2,3-dioxygenase-like lactoylglutathione lyase family enzyme